MNSRGNVASLGLAALLSLSCVSARQAAEVSAFEDACREGNADACARAAYLHYRDRRWEKSASWYAAACREGLPGSCYDAGMGFQGQDEHGRAQDMFDRGCRQEHRAACDERTQHIVTTMLERHPWIWGCVLTLGRGSGGDALLYVTATTEGGRTRLAADPLAAVYDPLGDCLTDTLAHSSFPAVPRITSALTTYALPLDYEHAAARRKATARHGFVQARVHQTPVSGEPSVRWCPASSSVPCRSQPATSVMDHGVYTPPLAPAKLAATHHAATPGPHSLVVQLCVEQHGGRTTHVERVGEDPAPALTHALLERVRGWRFRPWDEDETAEVCTRLGHVVTYEWVATQRAR